MPSTIAEIRARLAAATPGPYHCYENGLIGAVGYDNYGEPVELHIADSDGDTAKFLARSWDDIARLLELLDEAEAREQALYRDKCAWAGRVAALEKKAALLDGIVPHLDDAIWALRHLQQGDAARAALTHLKEQL